MLSLVRRDGANHPALLLRWHALDLAIFGKQLDDAVHHFATFIDMSVFTTTIKDRYLNLVVVLQKGNRLLDLKSDIVLARFGPHADFLELGLMRLAFGESLFLVVIEFTEVDNFANRRIRIGRDFNKIKSDFTCFV